MSNATSSNALQLHSIIGPVSGRVAVATATGAEAIEIARAANVGLVVVVGQGAEQWIGRLT